MVVLADLLFWLRAFPMAIPYGSNPQAPFWFMPFPKVIPHRHEQPLRT